MVALEQKRRCVADAEFFVLHASKKLGIARHLGWYEENGSRIRISPSEVEEYERMLVRALDSEIKTLVCAYAQAGADT